MNNQTNIKNAVAIISVLLALLLLGIGTYISYKNNWWQTPIPFDTRNFPDNELVNPSTTALPSNTPTPTVTQTILPTQPNYALHVYFSKHPESDLDPAKVFAVNRISHTLGVATFAINELIAGPSVQESNASYYSALANTLTGNSNCSGADFSIHLNKKGTAYESGTATMQFCREVLIPGELAGARIESEIDNTLLQFQNIKKVVILNKNGNCFNDLSGLNRCLE